MAITLDTYRNLSYETLIPRRVDVWLPPYYSLNPRRSFPVLYMHDGQNLFFRKKFILRTWKVAENITKLANENIIDPPIVVGIWNTKNRLGDYLPQKPMQSPEAQTHLEKFSKTFSLKIGEQTSDLYLRFIVNKLKPLIDSTYRTKESIENTCIMGSSMGGLISLYALVEFPKVFGKAGCISTHWPICDKHIISYLKESLPAPGKHKIYFDHGTKGIDANYNIIQSQVDNIMKEKGYTFGQDWITKVFIGDDHNEVYWSKRLAYPLKFLFNNSTS